MAKYVVCLWLLTLLVVPLLSCQAAGTDTVIVGTIWPPKSLNPLTAPDVVSKLYIQTMFSQLVEVNDKLEIVPELAEDYGVSPDGLEWTFKVRKGVKWHDGQELTAEDVKFTFEKVINDKNAQLRKSDYAAVQSIEVLDKYTVRFRLKERDAAFLAATAVGIVPKHLLEGQDLSTTDFNRQPLGSGPYVFEEWLQGSKVVVKTNPHYWGTEPKIKQLAWKLVPDSHVLGVQLLNREVDGAVVSPELLEKVKADPRLKIYETVDANTFIAFQTETPVFQDKRVRQALNYALDKKAIIEKILKGQGLPATTDLTPDSWAYNEEANPYPYDVGRARALLAEAGWKPGADGILEKDGQKLKFTLMTNAGDKTREQIVLFARQQWEEIGAQVEPRFIELNTFIFEHVLKHEYEAALLSGSFKIDPQIQLAGRYHSQATHNFLRYRNPQVDRLLEEAAATMDKEERLWRYREVQRIVADDCPHVSLYYPKVVYAFNSQLKGIKPSQAGLYWNVEDWSY